MLRRLLVVLAALPLAAFASLNAKSAAAGIDKVDGYSAASRFVPGVPIFRDDPRPVISIAIADTLVNPYDILSLRQTIRHVADLLPDYRIHTITITAAEPLQSLSSAKPDFLFAPADFVSVASRAYRLNLSRIATRKTPEASDAAHSVGAAIVVRSDSPYEKLEDLKNRRAATGLPTAIDGWLAALKEIQLAGFDETHFFKSVDYRNNAYPDVVSSLLAGKADAGILPACLLETLEARGLADTSLLRVINQKDEGLACRHSTALYPDLSLIALSYATEEKVRDMTIAILQLSESNRVQWLTNVPHGEVLSLFESLAVGPFSYLRENRFENLVERYRTEALTAFAALLLLILNEFRLHGLVRRRTAQLTKSMAEKNRIQAEAAQSRLQLAVFERRSLVQQMSGMIAHEINAPVGAIRSYAAVLKMQGASGRPADAGLIEKVTNAIDKEASRIAGIIARVRAYAKSSMPQQAPCDLVPIIRRSVTALMAERPEGKRPRVNYTPQTPAALVTGNALELEILFLNLMRNAANALTTDGLPEGLITCTLFATAEDRWKIVVTNHGKPASSEVIAHLNNKSAAIEASPAAYGGLGLGLTICRGIADSHAASLRFERAAEGSVSAVVEMEALTHNNDIPKENPS